MANPTKPDKTPDMIEAEAALIARAERMFGFDLPETFTHRNGDGTILQIKNPCYNLLSPNFLADTWYDEGEVVATPLCPNHEMQPLNRAAALRFVQWLDSLPAEGAKLTVEDMTEAAFMLAKDERYGAMGHRDRCKAVQHLALELKERRDAQLNGGAVMPASAGPASAVRAARSGAPAMPNIRIADANVRGPGAGGPTVLHDPAARRAAGPAASRITPALGVPGGAPAGTATFAR